MGGEAKWTPRNKGVALHGNLRCPVCDLVGGTSGGIPPPPMPNGRVTQLLGPGDGHGRASHEQTWATDAGPPLALCAPRGGA